MRLSLEGQGFFVLHGGGAVAYARSDEVYVSRWGIVTDRYGLALIAWPVDAYGATVGALQEILVPFSTVITIDPLGILRASLPGDLVLSYRLAIGRFEAPALLRRCTEDIFRPTVESGPSSIAVAQSQGNGSVVASGALR